MAKHRIGGMPVVDNGKLVGIITERDIINRIVAKGANSNNITVKDIMTTPPKVIGRISDDLTSLARRMVKNDVPRVPIVDDDKLVGIITNRDIARESPDLINVLLEQLNIRAAGADPVAFGGCEICGESAHLVFRQGRFICENCLG